MSLDERAPDETRNATTGSAPTPRVAAMADAPAVSPVQMALVVALALALAGLLYHLVIRIAARRSQRVNIDFAPPVWADNRPQRVQRNEPRPQAPVQERERHVAGREQFVDDSDVSLVPAASDEGVRRPLLGVDASPYKPRRKRVVAPAAGGIGEHENNLAQLIRDLDQLLQAKKEA